MRAIIIFAVLVAVSGCSQQSGPGEGKHKAESPHANDQHSQDIRHLLPPSLTNAPPIINVYTGKHASEVSHCAEPKDWKEWGAFSWCRSWEWIDAERVIAAWTIILGIATFLLFLATRKLVTDAKNAADRQETDTKILQRAYVAVEPGGILPFRDGTAQWSVDYIVVNTGNLPASGLAWFVDRAFSLDEYRSEFPIGKFEGNTTLAAKARARKVGFSLKIDSLFKARASVREAGIEGWLYVWGQINYLDGFNEGRFTKFCHRYNVRAIDAQGQIHPETGRYHIHGNSTDQDEEQPAHSGAP